jgi:probable proton-coupled thiamine transporter YuaJ
MSNFVKYVTSEEWGNYYELTTLGYITLISLMVLIFALGFFLFRKKETKKADTKQLVFSAMAIAIAMVTSMIKLFHLPMGGSITLFSMFFICLIGYLYGLGAGLTASLSYGLLQLIVNPYIISIPQMLTDYILAFGALGLSGLFCNKKQGLVKGYILGVLGRYFFSFLSGILFFGSYAAEYNVTAPVYSLAYNGIYLGTEAILTLIILAIPPVTQAISRIKRMALN